MSTTATADQLIEKAYQALLPDLTPQGAIERMFAAQIARYSVLTAMVTNQLIALDATAEGYFKKFRQLSQLLAGYERISKFAYTELRRLQTERAVAIPAADIYTMPRLARTAILTSSNRVVTKHLKTDPTSTMNIREACTQAEFEADYARIQAAKEKAIKASATRAA